jgi:hypothetical protein
MTVVASATASLTLSAVLLWLTKSWIGERIKGSIQHEYEQKIESYKARVAVENEREIEKLKMELGDLSAERNARRDYEYEARKKLYAEYEPLLFQLIERSEDAYHRVLSLARTARKGDITIDAGGWLESPRYYMLSTIYKLLAPAALFKIIQRNLTFVDLTLDSGIAANYTLAKILYMTFTYNFELADENPVLIYEAKENVTEKERTENPQRFWRQGIPLGCLDNILHDCMLSEDRQQCLRTFGEFERIVKKLTDDDPNHYITLLYETFENFHPYTRPILWRVLITQAHIHRLLIQRVGSRSKAPLKDMLSNLQFPSDEQSKFRWSDSAHDEDSFAVAQSFLKKRIIEFQISS